MSNSNVVKRLIMKRTLIGLVSIVSALSFNANADLIFSTDFQGSTVVDETLTNINWTTEGVLSPGDISADWPLFSTADSSNKVGVDRNLHNEGAWSVFIAINTLNEGILLDFFSLDAFIFNNAGNYQGANASRDLDYSVSIQNALGDILVSTTVDNIFNGSGTWERGKLVIFDLNNTYLDANNTYELVLTASGQGPGNNAGFDNVSLVGRVPAPQTFGLMVISLALFGLRECLKRK